MKHDLCHSPVERSPMRMRSIATSALLACLLSSHLEAQVIGPWGENTDPFRAPKTGWIADSLFIGATFLRDTTKDSFVIWLHRNEAGCRGSLYLMVPGGKNNGGDSALFLFKNKDNGGNPIRVNLTNNPLITAHIDHLDTLFFRYKVDPGFQCDTMSRFTGPNRGPGDNCSQGGPCQGIDRFYSSARTQCNDSRDSITSPDGSRHCIGRRWSVAGWIRNAAQNVRTDTVEFGFEDLVRGDNDFDDIVFHVTGVFLIRPSVVSDIRITAEPARDTILAGNSISYSTIVVVDSVDSFGIQHTVLDSVSRVSQIFWDVMDLDTAGTGARLFNGRGPGRRNTFTANIAYRTYTVRASIVDGGRVVFKLLTVYVLPNTPHHLVLELGYDVAHGLNLQRANPIDTLTIAASASRDSVYGIVRDMYGNYTSNSRSTSWGALPDTAIVSAHGERAALGEGVVYKKGPAGLTRVWGRDLDSSVVRFRDTIYVRVDSASFNDLRFVVGSGGQKRPITSLSMSLDADTLLKVEGRRTDGLGGDNFDGWVPISVQWTKAAGLITDTLLPGGSANQWLFSPITNTGTYGIYIRYGSTNLRDTLPVTLSAGVPRTIVLYPASGTTPFLSPNDLTYSWPAGSANNLVGRVFDAYGHALPQYENGSAPISWEIRSVATGLVVDTSIGSVTPTTGAFSTFVPKQAYTTVNVITRFSQGASIFSDTIRVAIQPGTATRLIIEATLDTTRGNRELQQVDLSGSDTSRTVYAVLRDQYYNFVARADLSTWLSRDTTVVSVLAGAPPYSGTVRRRTTQTLETQVLASHLSFVDSVRVTVTDYTYPQIRLVVNNGGFRHIDTLRQRTDQDTTLFVQGLSFNGQWVQVTATWSVNSLLGVTPPATNVDRWALRPAVADTGWIKIRKGNAVDSVRTFFLQGLPSTLVLYPLDATPNQGGNNPYAAPPTTDTLVAGSNANLVGFVFDQYGSWLSSYRVSTSVIRWSLIEVAGTGPTGTFSTTTGYTTNFRPTRAGNLVEVVATFSENGRTFTDAARFYIKPAAATHLVIEASPNRNASPYADNPLTSVNIGSADTVAYAYAVLRDQFGNYVSSSPATDWSSLNAAIVTAVEGTAVQGEGRIIRHALTGSTSVIARNRSNPALLDTVAILLDQVVYDSLQIVVNSGGLKRIDTLRLRTDQDTTLFAIGKRSDNKQWDAVSVRWTASGVNASPSAPPSANQWRLSPVDTDTGYVVVSAPGSGGRQLRDTIRVLFMPGLPNGLVIFPAATTPNAGGNTPYPGVPTTLGLIAGDTLPTAAMVFDHRGVWLNQYASLNAPITWRIVAASGSSVTGSMTRANGFSSGYTATDAYRTVDVIGEFNSLGITLRDTVRVTISADMVHHLVLEGSADRSVSPNDDAPLYGITLGSRDTVFDDIYAILRDQFGNWIDYARTTGWTSLDTMVATAGNGIAEVGQGWVKRKTNPGDTRVAVWDLGNPLLTDTIDVTVQNITYDAVRIVVNAGGLRDIDTLRMRTDQDTTLYALGQRSDNGKWDNLRVRWTSSGVTLDPVAPGSADQWTFSPTTATSGTITASASGTAGQLTDQLVIILTVGLPHHVVLFPQVGQPNTGANLAYNPPQIIDTVTSGVSRRLVAKIFDHNDVWLDTYERPSSPVTWTVVERSGNPPTGDLAPRNGYLSDYTGRRAYNVVYVIARFDSGGLTSADTVQLYVKAGAATHIVLEARPDPMSSPNNDNPAGVITISSRDTVANVYGVLRDQFGNYVGLSQHTGWTSLDTMVVTAGDGVPSIGEGRIIRRTSGGGQTSVIASSLDFPGLKDTVTVVLSTISYDSLRIVIGVNSRINELVMRTDQDTTLLVQGKRSDNGLWESVAASWQVSTGLRVQPSAPPSASSWSFTPADTSTSGLGWIRVTLGNENTTIPDTVRVKFNPGPPARLVLYPRAGAPAGDNQPYPDPTSAMTMTAGSSVTAVAKLVDHLGVWLGDTVVSWRIDELTGSPPTGTLSDTSGSSTTFRVVRAFNSAYLVGRYARGANVLLDTIFVNVVAGAAHHVVIEGSQNWLVSPNRDNPLDSITLTNFETYRSVYAIVRDALGNFVDYSRRTLWGSLDTTIASVTDGISSVGEGLVKNQRPGMDTLTLIIAESRDHAGFYDTLQVRVINAYFTQLRIVGGDTTRIGSLYMSTNDDTTLHVQGLRSDTKKWMDVQAYWITPSDFAVDPPAPEFDRTWSFSPTAPDTGWIIVTLNSDSTVPDTVPAFFRRGDPTRLDIELITPPNQRRAGDTLVAIVRIRNKDGLMPGEYCDSSMYQDILGDGGRSASPVAIVDGVTDSLNQRPDSAARMDQCFADGIDTVRFVLYYAPLDTVNQLFARVAGIEASTSPFNLLPAELSRIAIEDKEKNGRAVGDTVALLAPDGFLYVFAIGYDAFGNRIGSVVSDWLGSDDLSSIQETRVTRVYYSTKGIQQDKHGCIAVVASNTPSVNATVCVTITAPPPSLVWGKAYDRSGNGYLDMIDIKFKNFVTYPDSFVPNDFTIQYSVNQGAGTGTFYLLVDSVAGVNDARDTVFHLFLKENRTPMLQTSWRPRLSLARYDVDASAVRDVAAAASPMLICEDRAGPVIRGVTEQLRDGDVVVTVTFSEGVSSINTLDLPKNFFNVWVREAVGSDSTFTLVPGLLDGIGENGTPGFRSIAANTRDSVEFYMSNGKNLTGAHYLNIVVDSSLGVAAPSRVSDTTALENFPNLNNRKVKVVVRPSAPGDIVVGPNPASPDGRIPDLSIDYISPIEVRRILESGKGGAFLQFTIALDTCNGSSCEFPRLDAQATIHDMVGNLVATASKPDLLGDDGIDQALSQGGVLTYTFMWNGLSGDKRRVDPGVYRLIVRLWQYRNGTKLLYGKPSIGVIGIR